MTILSFGRLLGAGHKVRPSLAKDRSAQCLPARSSPVLTATCSGSSSWPLIAVTGGLAALIWLTQSLRFVELVVNHGLSLVVFLELTGLLIPSFVAVILPITSFVVVQFVYQRLAGDRELTVMRAAGLSPLALARPALAVAALAIGARLRPQLMDRARRV